MEPIVATMLAAGAAGCAVVGVALAASRGSASAASQRPPRRSLRVGWRGHDHRGARSGTEARHHPTRCLARDPDPTARRDARGGSAASSDGRRDPPVARPPRRWVRRRTVRRGRTAAVGDRPAGPLGSELRASLDAVHLGARWRTELVAVTERLALPDLRRAMAVLTRTETLGTSLTDATKDLAADVRSSRRASVAERARAAPVKMLFPLVFLILPAFLLLTVVPVLLTTVRSIR